MKHTSVSRIVALVGLCTLSVTGCAAATSGSPTATGSTAATSSAAAATTSSAAGGATGSAPASSTIPAVTQPSEAASSSTGGPSSAQPSTVSPAASSPPRAPAPSQSTRCPSSDLRLTLGAPGGAAGSVYYPLVFTNTGATPCALQGFPGVSYVTGNSGRQVGGPATWEGPPGRAVIVRPGTHATALLQEVDVANFPPAVCGPVSVRGLRVYPPGETHALFVPQAGAHGCARQPLPGGQFQLSVKAITAG